MDFKLAAFNTNNLICKSVSPLTSIEEAVMDEWKVAVQTLSGETFELCKTVKPLCRVAYSDISTLLSSACFASLYAFDSLKL